MDRRSEAMPLPQPDASKEEDAVRFRNVLNFQCGNG